LWAASLPVHGELLIVTGYTLSTNLARTKIAVSLRQMKDLFLLVAHLLAAILKLMRPGGARSVVAESLLLKHQLLVLNRGRKRMPPLSHWDRLLLALTAEFVAPTRICNRATFKQPTPRYLSSDNDPLFLYHRWRANLRVLDIHEIKSVPYTPISRPFVERLIGTVRRELLDRTFFWSPIDIQRKLDSFKEYYNDYRVHSSIAQTPGENRKTLLRKAST
jgi:hypothetical protein